MSQTELQMDVRRELFHKRVVLGVNKVSKTRQEGLVNKMCFVISKLIVF